MKHLTILVPDGQNNLSSIIGAYKIFTRANQYHKQGGNDEMFKIELAGLSNEVEFYDGIFSVRPHKYIKEIRKTDLIVIPSLNHNYKTAIRGNEPLVEWLKVQYSRGAQIASICTGAFLLASTGILEGKTCSTHWAMADDFSKMFPGVNLQVDHLITDENGIYTNGGAYSFLHLIIYLIEKYYNRETAIYCSKIFQIEMDRYSQASFAIFNGQRSHGDEMVIEAQSYLESHFHERISVDELSSKFAIGRRSFDRRFTRATGNTPLEYAQRVKVESAKKSLESSRKTVSEVMYEVGYSDLKAFREVFRKITGMSPLEYRNKYNKNVEFKTQNSEH